MGSNNKIVFLKPGRFYHIYNRACGFERLFLCDSNFRFFMDRFSDNLRGCVSLYAYCLMPNHFHFLIKTKDLNGIEDPAKTYSRRFSNFFNSYAKSFNKFNNRKGSLFSQNFKKKEIDSIEYLRSVTLYIHQNPVKHGYVDKIDKWKYSSYKETISGKSIYCQGNTEMIEWFNSLDILKFCHKIKVNIDLD
jgi:putative transposase